MPSRTSKAPTIIISKSRTKRRSTKTRSTKAVASGELRSNDTIIRGLRGTTSNPNAGTAGMYEMCRLSPFNGHGNAAIPDGSNSNFIVTDTFALGTIAPTAAGQDILIQTLPTLPVLAVVNSTTQYKVNGTTCTASSSPLVFDSSTSANSWTPLCVPSTFGPTFTPGNSQPDPYNSTAFRFISFGYRLIYTGPVNTCQGAITVTPNSATFTEGPLTNTSSGITLNSVSATLTTAAYATQIRTLVMDCGVNQSALQRSSVTYRPEQGCYLIAPHSSSSFHKMSNPQTICGVMTGNSLGVAGNVYNLFRNTNSCGVLCYDNDWSGFQIALTGLNSDASYRLEAVVCFEVNPAVTSAYYPMTRKASPLIEPAKLSAINQKAGQNSNQSGNAGRRR